MSKSINWLHFSDLHFGLDRHGWLWPRVKHDLFRDLERVAEDLGAGWDIVFFTGDFTQQATLREFETLNKELEEIWQVLSKCGNPPVLCAVPGNHDLVRPPSTSAVAKALTQLWSTNPELRLNFWQDEDCEYRRAVETYFENYVKWVANPPVPMLNTTPGALPGDFSATLEKGEIKLGIVGLNSTFLQIQEGDFKGKLEMHVSQLNQTCGGDPVRWLKARTASVLLTHQSPTWLDSDALQHFRQEIYPPGRFLAQLCGHQHEPEAFETSEAGALPRRLRQAPSLFGLEKWGGPTPTKRIHGYSAGQYIFEESEGFERLFPRVAVTGRHGGLNLAPDHSYTLQNDNAVTTPFDLGAETAEDDVHAEIAVAPVVAVEAVATPTLPELRLLETPLDDPAARSRLSAAPRLPLVFGPQHRFIRQEEQSQFELELRRSRWVWLVADWGTAKDGFLGSAVERFRASDQVQDVFHLRCDDADHPDALEALFPQQTGMSLQTFCTLVGSLQAPILVLDGIHPNLCKASGLEAITRIARAIIDYCPSLRLVLVSRLPQQEGLLPSIELRPLEVPDVRTYLLHHPDASPRLHEPDIVEKLHERTDGLPMHLDRILSALRVSSLESVLEAELEGTAAPTALAETTPKALVHAVSTLANSPERRTRRSFRLLQVLSVLPYGETLETLKHYHPTEPFFSENALQLYDAALLDVITLQQTSPATGAERGAEDTAPKLLKVPRQVRDYTQTLLTEEERWDIVLAGMERLFGRGWRRGKVKLRSLPLEYREYLSSGAGNESALIHYVIAHGRNTADAALVRRGQTLAIQYVRHLQSAERYRDLAMLASELTQLVESNDYPKDWAILAGLAGSGLRMMGKHGESLKYSNRALEVGAPVLADEEKAEIWLTVALAEESLGHVDQSVLAAEKVKAHSKVDSARYLQASVTIAGLTLKGEQREKELPALEKIARERGFETVANNIALDLASSADAAHEKLKHLDRVLAAGDRSYNQVRAIVSKADALSELETPKELKPQELASLAAAYSYLHAQRFGSLFDRCHRVLWRALEANQEVPKMLRLFRHTSFVWRIRGEESKEADYLTRLSKHNVQSDSTSGASFFPAEISYFLKRLKAITLSLASGVLAASAEKGAIAAKE